MNTFFENLEKDARTVVDKAKDAIHDIGENETDYIDAAHDLFAWANGKLISLPFHETASEKDQQMKTLAVMMIDDDELVAPCDGVVDGINKSQNLISVSLSNGISVGVKVCTGSVSFENEADILVKDGEAVKKGQPLVKFTKPISSKSKLLLTSAQSTSDFANMGYHPALTDSVTLTKGDLMITQRP